MQSILQSFLQSKSQSKPQSKSHKIRYICHNKLEYILQGNLVLVFKQGQFKTSISRQELQDKILMGLVRRVI